MVEYVYIITLMLPFIPGVKFPLLAFITLLKSVYFLLLLMWHCWKWQSSYMGWMTKWQETETVTSHCQHLWSNPNQLLCLCDQCKCWPGFHLKDDGKTCVDVDECSTTLPCSQRCINTYGSYKCLCVDGYEALERTPNTCKALSGQPAFLTFTLQIFSE